MAGRSGMTGDCHVPFCEGLEVKFLRATRLCNSTKLQIVARKHKFAKMPKMSLIRMIPQLFPELR